MNPELQAIDEELARREQETSQSSTDQGGVTLTSLAKAVYEPTLAASQGLIQGVENFSERGGISLRNITDSIGLTSIEKTEALRQQNAQANQVTDAAAEKLGSPTIGSVSKFAGEIAPAVALGSAFGLPSIAGQALTGGVLGGLQDSNNGLTGQLQSAALGAIASGVLGKASKYIGSKFGLDIDPSKAEMYRAAGATPRASQVAADPKVATTYAWIEKSLAKLPGPLGIKGTVAKQEESFLKNLPTIVDQLDGKTIKSAPLFAKAIDSPAVNLKTYVPGDVLGQTKLAANKLKTFGEQAPKQVLAKVQELLGPDGKGIPMTISELHTAKKGIDEMMDTLRGGNSAEQSSFWILNDIRKDMSNAIKRIATSQGVGKEYELTNASWISEKYIKGLKNAVSNSYKNLGDAESGDAFQLNKFSTEINKFFKQMKAEGFDLPDEVGKSMQTVKTIVAQLNSKNAVKLGKSTAVDFINPFRSEGAINAAAGATGYFAGIPAAIGLGTISAGLSQLVTTPLGIKLLAKAHGKGFGHDAMRAVLTTSAALGAATAVHKQESDKQSELKAIDAELMLRQQEQQSGAPQ